MSSVFDHISCIVPGERISSAPDFIGIAQSRLLDDETTEEFGNYTERLERQVDDLGLPVWLSSYSTVDDTGVNNEDKYEVTDETVLDTATLYNQTNDLVGPKGSLSGGNRYTW